MDDCDLYIYIKEYIVGLNVCAYNLLIFKLKQDIKYIYKKCVNIKFRYFFIYYQIHLVHN